ncbi:MAG: hypothetical protein H6719_10110 [Sandaracinaceae bacterium]|nr:hypothetical protein [Sandaracinaceae bacterium]
MRNLAIPLCALCLVAMPARANAQRSLLERVNEALGVRPDVPRRVVWEGRWTFTAPGWAIRGDGRWPGLYDARDPDRLFLGLVETASAGEIDSARLGRVASELHWIAPMHASRGPHCLIHEETRGPDGGRRVSFDCDDGEPRAYLLEHPDGRYLLVLPGPDTEATDLIDALRPLPPQGGERIYAHGGHLGFTTQGRPLARVPSGLTDGAEMVAEIHSPGDLRVAVVIGEPNHGPLRRWERRPRKISILGEAIPSDRSTWGGGYARALLVDGCGLGHAAPIVAMGRSAEELERAISLLEGMTRGPAARPGCRLVPSHALADKLSTKGPLADKPDRAAALGPRARALRQDRARRRGAAYGDAWSAA